jgi:hypothetical protein
VRRVASLTSELPLDWCGQFYPKPRVSNLNENPHPGLEDGFSQEPGVRERPGEQTRVRIDAGPTRAYMPPMNPE